MSRAPIDSGPIDTYLTDVEAFKSEGTYNVRHSDLKNFFSWMQEHGPENLTAVESTHIKRYLIHNDREGYAPSTINSRYNSVNELFKSLAGEQGVMDYNPVDNFDYSKASNLMDGTKKGEGAGDDIIYVTPDEVDQMVEHVAEPVSRNKLLIRLLFQTGIRVHECENIKLENINTEERKISVYSKKTDSSRSVFYQPSLDTFMSLWLNQLRQSFKPAKSSEYLFVSYQTEQLTKYSIRHIVKESAKEAGINSPMYEDANGVGHWRITPHALRHGHCVHALKQGIDIGFIREHAGHENLETTKQYLQLIDKDVRDAYHKFEGN